MRHAKCNGADADTGIAGLRGGIEEISICEKAVTTRRGTASKQSRIDKVFKSIPGGVPRGVDKA